MQVVRLENYSRGRTGIFLSGLRFGDGGFDGGEAERKSRSGIGNIFGFYQSPMQVLHDGANPVETQSFTLPPAQATAGVTQFENLFNFVIVRAFAGAVEDARSIIFD